MLFSDHDSYNLSFCEMSAFFFVNIFFLKNQSISESMLFTMRNNVFTPVFIKREQNHRWHLCKQWIYKCYEVYKKRLDVRKTTRCNYFLIQLANFALIVVWRFTLFLPSAWVQRSTSGNPACSDPTAIPRESNTVYHSKRH